MKTKKEPIYSQGILITKPWSKEMYNHNNDLAILHKEAITKATIKAAKDGNEDTIRTIGKAVNSYGYGDMYTINMMLKDILSNINTLNNHWLHSDTWPDLLKANIVTEIKTKYGIPITYVGY